VQEFDKVWKQLEQSVSGEQNATALGLCVYLLLAAVLALYVRFLYRKCSASPSDSDSISRSFPLLALVTTAVIAVVKSSLALSLGLVGALSIVRFRNAVKETRDVGFVFFVMIIGMAAGTRFYVLAAVAATTICLVILIMVKFNLFALNNVSQILKIQVANDANVEGMFDDVFLQYTKESDLISIDTVRSGTLTELIYSVVVKRDSARQEFISAIRARTGNERVSLITGYDTTDL
jgi:uncharacterized membrane protein YhiD involved in acid resistance